jgi:hypothetical protein
VHGFIEDWAAEPMWLVHGDVQGAMEEHHPFVLDTYTYTGRGIGKDTA